MENWILFSIIPSIFCIAYLDYLVFSKWTKCDVCHNTINKWYNYLLPTFIEISLFIIGIYIGLNIK